VISAADLSSMRDTLDGSLPDSADVHRRTSSSNGALGSTDTWAPVGTYAVRVSPLGRSDRLAELEVAARLAAVTSWILTFPDHADVTERDRVFVGARDFELASILGPRSWELGRRVMAQEVN
jgi:hypothetical protein